MTGPRISELRTLLLLCVLALLAACASAPPKPVVDFKPGYDFSKVRKIAFYERSGEVHGDNPLQLSDMQKNRIDEALQLAMTSKGLVWVDDASQADLLLSWNLVTENKTDVRTYETPTMGMGVGYGRYNRYSMYSCWSCTQTEVSVKNYTQGTFIVDMIDPELKQSVWRSVVESRMKGDHKQDQDKYNEAAVRILGGFPPGLAVMD